MNHAWVAIDHPKWDLGSDDRFRNSHFLQWFHPSFLWPTKSTVVILHTTKQRFSQLRAPALVLSPSPEAHLKNQLNRSDKTYFFSFRNNKRNLQLFCSNKKQTMEFLTHSFLSKVRALHSTIYCFNNSNLFHLSWSQSGSVVIWTKWEMLNF